MRMWFSLLAGVPAVVLLVLRAAVSPMMGYNMADRITVPEPENESRCSRIFSQVFGCCSDCGRL